MVISKKIIFAILLGSLATIFIYPAQELLIAQEEVDESIPKNKNWFQSHSKTIIIVLGTAAATCLLIRFSPRIQSIVSGIDSNLICLSHIKNSDNIDMNKVIKFIQLEEGRKVATDLMTIREKFTELSKVSPFNISENIVKNLNNRFYSVYPFLIAPVKKFEQDITQVCCWLPQQPAFAFPRLPD